MVGKEGKVVRRVDGIGRNLRNPSRCIPSLSSMAHSSYAIGWAPTPMPSSATTTPPPSLMCLSHAALERIPSPPHSPPQEGSTRLVEECCEVGVRVWCGSDDSRRERAAPMGVVCPSERRKEGVARWMLQPPAGFCVVR